MWLLIAVEVDLMGLEDDSIDFRGRLRITVLPSFSLVPWTEVSGYHGCAVFVVFWQLRRMLTSGSMVVIGVLILVLVILIIIFK